MQAVSQSSPRPWGCFHHAGRWLAIQGVVPTPVGVFLKRPSPLFDEASRPHARGGVSTMRGDGWRFRGSSPRPWGCF